VRHPVQAGETVRLRKIQIRPPTLAKCLLRSTWAVHPTDRSRTGETLPARKPATGEPCAGEPHVRSEGGELLPDPYRGESRDLLPLALPGHAPNRETAALRVVGVCADRVELAQRMGTVTRYRTPLPAIGPRRLSFTGFRCRWLFALDAQTFQTPEWNVRFHGLDFNNAALPE
jgi:hypothetical protein